MGAIRSSSPPPSSEKVEATVRASNITMSKDIILKLAHATIMTYGQGFTEVIGKGSIPGKGSF